MPIGCVEGNFAGNKPWGTHWALQWAGALKQDLEWENMLGSTNYSNFHNQGTQFKPQNVSGFEAPKRHAGCRSTACSRRLLLSHGAAAVVQTPPKCSCWRLAHGWYHLLAMPTSPHTWPSRPNPYFKKEPMMKSGQGPPGRVLAVRQFSPLRRREGLPPQPQTTRSGPKTPAFYGVLCSSHFFPFFGSCGLRWVNMGQHRPQDGPT